MISVEELTGRLSSFPRVSLAHLPTRLEPLPVFSKRVGATIHMKRDDQTGLAFGGNKSRKLEFIMADVVASDARSVVTWAGVQSNWCRQVAAAAARVGRRAVLVLLKRPGLPAEEDGNLLIDRVFDADIHIREASGEKGFLELDHVREYLDPVVEKEEAEGRRPYVAPVGGSLLEGSMTRPLGAMGYLAAFAELLQQARSQGFTPRFVVLATGSAGTQAGLVAGAKLLSPETQVVGISVSGSKEIISRYVTDIANAVLDEVGDGERVKEEEVTVFDEYVGEGYGILTESVARTVGAVARDEGVLLDPVYTGKAMVGLMDLARNGYFQGGDVVFVHTGGTPALFPYREGILKGLGVPAAGTTRS